MDLVKFKWKIILQADDRKGVIGEKCLINGELDVLEYFWEGHNMGDRHGS